MLWPSSGTSGVVVAPQTYLLTGLFKRGPPLGGEVLPGGNARDNSNPLSLFRNFRGAQQGPGRELAVAQLAMGYLSLRQPERQKDSPRQGSSHFYTAST